MTSAKNEPGVTSIPCSFQPISATPTRYLGIDEKQFCSGLRYISNLYDLESGRVLVTHKQQANVNECSLVMSAKQGAIGTLHTMMTLCVYPINMTHRTPQISIRRLNQ